MICKFLKHGITIFYMICNKNWLRLPAKKPHEVGGQSNKHVKLSTRDMARF